MPGAPCDSVRWPGLDASRRLGGLGGDSGLLPPCRTLICERGLLARADGSARWSQGGSEVLAAVHGPRQTATRKEDPERAILEVTWKPASGIAGKTCMAILYTQWHGQQ